MFSFSPLPIETGSQLLRDESGQAPTSLKLKYCLFALKTIENCGVVIAPLNQNIPISYKICRIIGDIVVSGECGLEDDKQEKRLLQRLGPLAICIGLVV